MRVYIGWVNINMIGYFSVFVGVKLRLYLWHSLGCLFNGFYRIINSFDLAESSKTKKCCS